MAAGPSHASDSMDWYAPNARRSCESWVFLSHGSGSSIETARGSERPFITRNSSTLSSTAESEPSLLMTGMTFFSSAPITGEYSSGSRARTPFTLPRSVLISPLWMMYRLGCARSQLGVVFVE